MFIQDIFFNVALDFCADYLDAAVYESRTEIRLSNQTSGITSDVTAML